MDAWQEEGYVPEMLRAADSAVERKGGGGWGRIEWLESMMLANLKENNRYMWYNADWGTLIQI